jgi:glucan phosphoethanolaminetransferase (alkaline phosphatase superfamily)
MELDEIKKTWSDLNGRLEKVESLNKKLVTAMLNEKQQTAKDKLKTYEKGFLIVSIVFMFVTLFEYYLHIFNGITIILFEFVFVFSAIWQAYKLYLLKQMRINTCSTTELIQKAIRFRVLTRLHTLVGMLLLIPILVLLFKYENLLSDPYMMIGVIVGLVLGLIIGFIYFFKNLGDIDALIKSYKDLNDNEDFGSI